MCGITQQQRIAIAELNAAYTEADEQFKGPTTGERANELADQLGFPIPDYAKSLINAERAFFDAGAVQVELTNRALIEFIEFGAVITVDADALAAAIVASKAAREAFEAVVAGINAQNERDADLTDEDGGFPIQ